MKNVKNKTEIDETLNLLSDSNTSERGREGKFIQKIKEKLEQENFLDNQIPAKTFYEFSHDLNNDPNIPLTDCVNAFKYFAKGDQNYNSNIPIGGFKK